MVEPKRSCCLFAAGFVFAKIHAEDILSVAAVFSTIITGSGLQLLQLIPFHSAITPSSMTMPQPVVVRHIKNTMQQPLQATSCKTSTYGWVAACQQSLETLSMLHA
jgi:hypothetical protein